MGTVNKKLLEVVLEVVEESVQRPARTYCLVLRRTAK
jgi:hypothetical protein